MRSRSRSPILLATFALALGFSGCASGGSGGGGSTGGPNRLNAEALGEVQQLDAYQAIQRLRPNWLRSRGGSAVSVILDGNKQVGGLDTLRSVRVADLQEMQFLSASDATTRFGTGYDGGAILLRTKR